MPIRTRLQPVAFFLLCLWLTACTAHEAESRAARVAEADRLYRRANDYVTRVERAGIPMPTCSSIGSAPRPTSTASALLRRHAHGEQLAAGRLSSVPSSSPTSRAVSCPGWR